MENNKRTDAVNAGLSLNGDIETVRNHYDAWADSYNADLSAADYIAPQETVNVLVEFLKVQNTLDYDSQIIDGGCGTGLVGVYLTQAGFGYIDGFDPSTAMVEKAILTKVYTRLEGAVGFKEAADTFGNDIYDIGVTCGVFTQGHVPPEAVFEFAKVVKPKGLLLVVTRPSYCDETDFETISQSGSLKLLKCFRDRAYTADENAHYWVFQK